MLSRSFALAAVSQSCNQWIQVICMASENDIYREAARREHRSFAMQLAVRALASRVQCVAFAYEDLKVVFGLSSLRDTRVDWICHDIRPWFPFWITDADRCVRPGRLPLFLSSIELPEFDTEPPLPFIYLTADELEAISEKSAVSEILGFAIGLDVPSWTFSRKLPRFD